MRIAVLCHMHHPIAEPFQGGTETHTAILADELVARGHDVTLFAKEGSETTAAVYPLVPADFEFVFAASPLVRVQQKGFLAEAVHHSIQIISEGDFDIVINNSLSVLPYTHMRHLPMLTILHTPPTLADVNAIVTSPGWMPSPQHLFVTVSESNAAPWRLILPEVHVVHNGVLPRPASAEGVTPADADAADLAATLSEAVAGFADSGARAYAPYAAWAARITPEKGLHVAIEAAARAGIELRIAGPIADPRYFEEDIEPLLGRGATYVGHLDSEELDRFLAAASVFVASPLWAEPFGLSVVEALRLGTPVAALPNGALPELISTANGALARDDSAASLGRAIRTARRRDRTRVEASAAPYTVTRMVDGYERLLDRILAGNIETADVRATA
jgi:glycosyltransferase involved in cell wall biosynthesis